MVSATAACMRRAGRDARGSCSCAHAAGHNMALLQPHGGRAVNGVWIFDVAMRVAGQGQASQWWLRRVRAARTPGSCVQVTSAAAMCGRAVHGVAGTCHSGSGCRRRRPAGWRVSSQVMCPGFSCQVAAAERASPGGSRAMCYRRLGEGQQFIHGLWRSASPRAIWLGQNSSVGGIINIINLSSALYIPIIPSIKFLLMLSYQLIRAEQLRHNPNDPIILT